MFRKKKKECTEELFFNSEIERLKIASSLIPTIQERIKQEGIFDYIKTRVVEPGEIIAKQKNANHLAAAVDEFNDKIETIKAGTTVFPAEFIITSKPTIPITQILKKQYDLLEKIADTVVSDLLYEIKKSWYRLLQASAIMSEQYFKYNQVDRLKAAMSKTSALAHAFDFIKKNMVRDPEEECCLMVSRDFLGKIHRWSKQHNTPVQNLFNAVILVPDVSKESEGRIPFIPDNVLICFPKKPVVEMDIRIELAVLNADQFRAKIPECGFLYLQMQSLCIRDCSKISMIKLPE